jgi:hypothetical protein
LPPYQSINYFYAYAGYHFFAPWLISLAAAIVISRLAGILNSKYGERFFENEEIWLMRLGIFLTGYPGFLFYLVLVLLAGVALSSVYTILKRGRAPLYYVWLPLAIIVLIIKDFLVPVSILNIFTL